MSGVRRGAFALVFVLACGGGVASTGPEGPGAGPVDRPGPGRLVVAGGAVASTNQAIWQAVLDARDGPGPVCVLPTASGSPETSMASAVETLDGYGGRGAAEGVLLTIDAPQRAFEGALVQQLERCAGFWFTGGDQSRIVDVFRPDGDDSPAYRAVRQRWLDGAVVAGSSAGAAMMSGRMIAGGSSADALAQGVRHEEDGEGVWLRTGMAFFETGVLDQHFLARGRWGRLLVAVLAEPAVDVGLGVDENTALVVDGDEARVVGESAVVVLDARTATASDRGTVASGVRMQLVGTGDALDLATLTASPSPGKRALEAGPAPEPPVDPFARWALLELAAAHGASDADAVDMTASGRRIRLEKGSAFRAVAAGPGGPEGTPAGLTAGPWIVSVTRLGS